MVFPSFNNSFFRKGQRAEKSRAHDIGFPTLIAGPSFAIEAMENEANSRVARQKHPRPPPLSLNEQKALSQQEPKPTVTSSIDSSEIPRSKSVSAGGALFELMDAPNSANPESTLPPIPNFPTQSFPSPDSPGHRSETKKNRPTRRHGVPSEATRPNFRHRASSVDSPLPSPTALKTGISLPSRKDSGNSSAPSYSVYNDGTPIFSPVGQSPSTAYTTPLQSASADHFHHRDRLFSLGNTGQYHEGRQPVSHSPISPRKIIEHKIPSSPSLPIHLGNSILGISSPSWNVSFPASTTTSSRTDEEIIPDSTGLILELSQNAETSSQTLLEPVLQKRVGRDSNGKEFVKWELRLCLPPRRYGSSPAVGIPTSRSRRPSRTTPALKLSGIGEAPIAEVLLDDSIIDHRPILPPTPSKKKTLGSNRSRGSSLSVSPGTASQSYLERRRPKTGSPTHRQDLTLSVLVTQASPSSTSSTKAVYGRESLVINKPSTPPVDFVPSQASTQTEKPKSGISKEEDQRALETSEIDEPNQSTSAAIRRISPSALLARRLAHSKLLGRQINPNNFKTADFDLNRLSAYSHVAPDISYWSETDASQTGADDDDDGDDEEEPSMGVDQTVSNSQSVTTAS